MLPLKAHRTEIDVGPVKEVGDNLHDLPNKIPALIFPFQANFNDHFETGIDALKDLLPSIRALREATHPNNSEAFWIYDPYFCAGHVKERWATLGFPSVHHECRDFYDDVKKNFGPNYDVLVTNPPYSADHIPRLFDILVTKRKPFAVLVPDYVAKKPWYLDIVKRCFTPSTLFAKPGVLIKKTAGVANIQSTSRSVDFSTHPLLQGLVASTPAVATPYTPPAPRFIAPPKEEADQTEKSDSSNDGEIVAGEKTKRRRKRYANRHRAKNEPLGPEPFYLLPKNWYDFEHPQGVGNAHSHFRSMWIVWCGGRHAEVLLAARAAAVSSNNDLQVCSGLLELEHRGLVEQRNRLNPQQRTKQRSTNWVAPKK